MVWYQDSYSPADAETWVRRSVAEHEGHSGYHFVMCGDDGALVGVTSLEDVGATDGRAMLGYWVATPAAGRGVATQAVAQVLDWARNHTNIGVIWALIAEENLGSRRVVEANGFHVAGTREPPASTEKLLIYEIDTRSAKRSAH
jgi:RimJ/RimL family protein N-acetyltransferase